MRDLEVLDQLDRLLANGQPIPDLSAVRRWIQDRRRAAVVLLFRPAALDAGQRQVWEVGHAANPIQFTARTGCMRWLHWLAANPARGLAVTDITDASSGAEAARRALKSAVDELQRYCDPLAVQLGTFSIERGFVYYRPRQHYQTIQTE